MSNKYSRGAGVTLVELIVALVIIGVALGGMVAVFARTTRASVDPMIQQQMAAIADNLMEEILLKPFAPGPGTNGRINYDDVRDYADYNHDNAPGISDVEGNPIPGLEAYTVNVEVKPQALTGIPSTDALVVTVTVGHADVPDFVLTGWRTRR